MSQDISELREHLFAALKGVKDGSLDLDKARAINDLGKTLIDSAKVEVDYLRATGGAKARFWIQRSGWTTCRLGSPAFGSTG
jgi:hypothetical protein